jgi:hypothetical protein
MGANGSQASVKVESVKVESVKVESVKVEIDGKQP